MARLVIGEVLKPQGIRGEIKIKTYTDENAAVKNFRRVFIGGEEYKVLSFRTGESGFWGFAVCRTATRRNFCAVKKWRPNATTLRRLTRGRITS